MHRGETWKFPVVPLSGTLKVQGQSYEVEAKNGKGAILFSSIALERGSYFVQVTGDSSLNTGITLSLVRQHHHGEHIETKRHSWRDIWKDNRQFVVQFYAKGIFDLQLGFNPLSPVYDGARFHVMLDECAFVRNTEQPTRISREKRNHLFPMDHHHLHSLGHIMFVYGQKEYVSALAARETLHTLGLYPELISLDNLQLKLEWCWQSKQSCILLTGAPPTNVSTLDVQQVGPSTDTQLGHQWVLFPYQSLGPLLESWKAPPWDMTCDLKIPRLESGFSFIDIRETHGLLMFTHNNAETLETSLQSIIAQSFPYWHLIIIDCESKDNTKEVIQKFQDHRIHLYIPQTKLTWEGRLKLGLTELSRYEWGAVLYPTLYYATDFLHSHALHHTERLCVLDRLIQIHPTTRTIGERGHTFPLAIPIDGTVMQKQVSQLEGQRYVVGRHQAYLYSFSFPIQCTSRLKFQNLKEFFIQIYYKCTGLHVSNRFIQEQRVNQMVILLETAHLFNILCLTPPEP